MLRRPSSPLHPNLALTFAHAHTATQTMDCMKTYCCTVMTWRSLFRGFPSPFPTKQGESFPVAFPTPPPRATDALQSFFTFGLRPCRQSLPNSALVYFYHFSSLTPSSITQRPEQGCCVPSHGRAASLICRLAAVRALQRPLALRPQR